MSGIGLFSLVDWKAERFHPQITQITQRFTMFDSREPLKKLSSKSIAAVKMSEILEGEK